MPVRFTVGEMAKFHHLSKQTLIFYDRQGVFSPKQIDAHNGYRYYTPDQLEELDSILMLKEMGLSLKEIRNFLAQRDGEEAVRLLKRRQAEIHRQVQRLRLIEWRLNKKIKTLENMPENSSRIECITCGAEPLLTEPVQPPYTLLETDIAQKKLLHRASMEKVPYYYQTGVMVPIPEILKGNYVCARFVFLPLEHGVKQAGYLQKPAGRYLRGYHEGEYETIGETYRLLLSTAEKMGEKPAGFSYEYCIFDSLTSRQGEDYITEIQLLLEPVQNGTDGSYV